VVLFRDDVEVEIEEFFSSLSVGDGTGDGEEKGELLVVGGLAVEDL
jgi:hypothetical protein